MTSSDAPLVMLDHVSKRYGDKLAVSDLTLQLPRGDLFAFLGPNGAGKTTTIKMLTGLLRPTRGRVVVAGHDMATDSTEARRAIAYVPDQPHLYDKLSGRDFLRFTRDIHGLNAAAVHDWEAELIDLFEMGDYVDELSETYSHGMRQRLVFAAALLHHPQVLVVDEPMVGLDPKSVRIVKDLLRRVSREGTTVFMSTHTLGVAEEIADHVGIIFHGQMLRYGTIADLRAEAGPGVSLEDFFLRVTGEAGSRERPAAVVA